MTNQIKENVVILFPISLIISYFSCFGFYKYYNLDITSFLSIQDLTLIYAKWIWLVILIIILTIAKLSASIDKIENAPGWWDEVIGRTTIKRRALIILPLILLGVILAFLYKNIANIFLSMFVILIVLIILIVVFAEMEKALTTNNKLSEIKLNEWITIIPIIMFLIVIVPAIAGLVFAKYSSKERIKVTFNDNTFLNTGDSSKLTFIGKTSEYIFINNADTKIATVYRMDNVKSLEYYPLVNRK